MRQCSAAVASALQACEVELARLQEEEHAEADRIIAAAREHGDGILKRAKVLDAHFKSTMDKIASG